MESKRLFLAIQPPPDICALLASTARKALEEASLEPGRTQDDSNETEARSRSIGPHRTPTPIRLIGEQNLHLTLQFLGDTPAESIGRIEAALQPRLAACPCVSLEVSRFGCFPSPRRPRVVWAGLREPGVAHRDAPADAVRSGNPRENRTAEPARPGTLLRVYGEVCSGLAECGIRCETRPFQAHVTVGYVRREAENPGAAVRRFLECADATLTALPAAPIRFDAVEVAVVESRLTPKGAQYRNLAVLPLRRDRPAPD